MKNIIEKSILIRNLDLSVALIAGLLSLIFLRSENHGLNGILYQWIAYLLIMTTTVSLGSYTQRKIFPYFRPDKYLPEGAKSSLNINVTPEQFKMAIMCGWFRLAYLSMWVLAGIFMLRNLV